MKKIILTMAMTIAAFNVNAQINLDADGNIAMKGGFNTDYAVTLVAGNRKPMIVQSQNLTGSTWANALTGLSIPTSSTWGAGLTGMSTNSAQNGTMGRSFGVLGCAGNATNGYNYGVYGLLLTNHNGAAVFGTTTSSEYGTLLTSRYAGYFHGLVGVKGQLNVTEGIYGTILGPSASSSPTSTFNNSLEDLALVDRLSGLSASSFYQDKNENKERKSSLDSDSDTLEIEVSPSDFELQVQNKLHYGLSAEQLEEAFPDLVYETEDGQKMINYMEMVPILVQAIKELNAKIKQVSSSTALMNSQATGTNSLDDNILSISMGQNSPNPFSNRSSIEVSIPQDVQKAFLYVYDLNGKKIQQVDITHRGKQEVFINAGELSDGMYLYSLVTDGKIIQTRKMIVEK